MPLTYNGNTPAAVTYNGNPVSEVTYNGVTVWSAAPAQIGSVLTIEVPDFDTRVDLNYTQSAANAVTVDWGDGSAAFSSSNLTVSQDHTYPDEGRYEITITCADGETWNPGGGTTGTAVIDYQKEALLNATFDSKVTTTNTNAFYQNDMLASVSFSNSFVSTGANCFNGCQDLNNVVLGTSFTTFGNQTFYNCIGLTSINIPSGISAISNGLFRNCTSLASIDIPSGVSTIGSNVFNGCTSLMSITCNATTPPTISNINTFLNVPANCAIYVPAGSVAAYQADSMWGTRAAYIQAIP